MKCDDARREDSPTDKHVTHQKGRFDALSRLRLLRLVIGATIASLARKARLGWSLDFTRRFFEWRFFQLTLR